MLGGAFLLFVHSLSSIMASSGSLVFSSVSSLVAGFPAVSFSGSRSGSAAAGAFVSALAVASPSLPVRVGCAAGVDALVRSAFPAAGVFRAGSHRGALAARSTRLVQASGAAGALLVAFPRFPEPPRGCVVGRSFQGGGSGTWGSVALALGLGFPVLVWCSHVVSGPPPLPGLSLYWSQPRGAGPASCGSWWFSAGAGAAVQPSLF